MAAICHTAARGGWAFECPFVRLGVGLARLCHATSRGGLQVLDGAHGLGVGLGKVVRVGLARGCHAVLRGGCRLGQPPSAQEGGMEAGCHAPNHPPSINLECRVGNQINQLT